MPKKTNYQTTLILRTPRVLADAVADVAARQFMTPSEFTRQALLDRLLQFGITLRSLPSAQGGDGSNGNNGGGVPGNRHSSMGDANDWD